jgi:hypothetical protein
MKMAVNQHNKNKFGQYFTPEMVSEEVAYADCRDMRRVNRLKNRYNKLSIITPNKY